MSKETENIKINPKEEKDTEAETISEINELTATNKLIVLVGYIFSIFFPVIGLFYGIILLLTKKELSIYTKHAPYIIIIAIAMLVIIALCEILYFHII